MDTPTVGHQRTIDTHPTTSTQAGASGQRSTVTLVDLRPMRNIHADGTPRPRDAG